MDDELPVELNDLATDEIQELLAESGLDLTPEQVAVLSRFVEEAGGLEEAREALAALLADNTAKACQDA